MTDGSPGRPGPIEVPECPSCGSPNVYAIWYGEPIGDPHLTWPPNVISAGCVMPVDEPSHECQRCGHKWRDPSLPPPYGTAESYEWHKRPRVERQLGQELPD